MHTLCGVQPVLTTPSQHGSSHHWCPWLLLEVNLLHQSLCVILQCLARRCEVGQQPSCCTVYFWFLLPWLDLDLGRVMTILITGPGSNPDYAFSRAPDAGIYRDTEKWTFPVERWEKITACAQTWRYPVNPLDGRLCPDKVRNKHIFWHVATINYRTDDYDPLYNKLIKSIP